MATLCVRPHRVAVDFALLALIIHQLLFALQQASADVALSIEEGRDLLCGGETQRCGVDVRCR